MAELKTKPRSASVDAFLKKSASGEKLKDCYRLVSLMKKITKQRPKMWGPSIVGFGTYHYKYATGHEGDMPVAAFSPRKQALTIYILTGLEVNAKLFKKLGKFKSSKACLYIKKLADVDQKVLAEIIKESVNYVKSFKEFPHRAK
jgi:hypothetical protein